MKEGETKLRYCLYARKSSESDERQAMSIDSQLKEMRELAKRDGLNVVCELEESHSAKESGQRPVFNQMVEGIASGKYNAILTWAADRLSRNAGDLGSIVDLMDCEELLHIKTYSQTFTNNPNEKFLLMILCSQAKLENDNKSLNVKRGIKTKCEMGWRPGVAPLGYINRAFGGIKDIVPDPERAEIVTEMFMKASQGWSGRRLKSWLDEINFTTRNGKPISVSSVLEMLINPFYYGEFQYSDDSGGKWFKGAHQPLISKELFDIVQQTRGINKGLWGTKQFAFRGLIMCGRCGSCMTAQEKFKKLKNGEYVRYVYYCCAKNIRHECDEKYMNENDLCKKLMPFIEKKYRDIKVNDKLRVKIEKHISMSKSLLEHYKVNTKLNNPLVEYSRFILTNGTESEKTSFADGVKTKIKIIDGELSIA
ncbi:MAG: recombinase family protein [Candidatus Nomurabacteria bacterium]|jgi:DNA invertase Pin-like site-specific DNA recombinase|nr:recombinase family protein [Candidatus Nomurabacteria bacterium]